MSAFGSTAVSETSDVPVVAILHRPETNTVVVLGEDARMSVYELKNGAKTNSKNKAMQVISRDSTIRHELSVVIYRRKF
jgi:hypothetical protein